MDLKGDGRPCHEAFEKPVLVHVVGGSLDGRTLDSRDPIEAAAVLNIWSLTNGVVGKGVEGLSLDHIMRIQKSYNSNSPLPESPEMPHGLHTYHIEDRTEDDETIHLHIRYGCISHEERKLNRQG